MAFSLTASVGDDSISLSDGNPFALESAEGLSGASIARHEQRGPLQGGVTDRGYRLAPRTITLNVLFWANTDALLDAHRDTLLSTFKPLANTGITLTATRDDGGVRTLPCHAAGGLDIPITPADRPGHLHRARVQLRAADPLWTANEPAVGTLDYSTVDQWWLAGGAIDEAEVLARVEYPEAGDQWDIGADLAGTTAWGVAVIAARFESGTTKVYLWKDSSSGVAGVYYSGTPGRYIWNSNATYQPWPGASTENYHSWGNAWNGYWKYFTGGGVAEHVSAGGALKPLKSRGTWRLSDSNSNGTPWGEIRRAMIWRHDGEASEFLNGSALRVQAEELAAYMLSNNIGSAYTGTVNVVNSGDVPAYPLISLSGPLDDPVITNTTTGATIDLTGLTIPNGKAYTLDLRDGNKTMADTDGNSIMGDVSTFPVSIADFALAPSPVAAGGTNVITVATGSAGMDAVVTFDFTEKYMSF